MSHPTEDHRLAVAGGRPVGVVAGRLGIFVKGCGRGMGEGPEVVCSHGLQVGDWDSRVVRRYRILVSLIPGGVVWING